jgi:transposase-like protein
MGVILSRDIPCDKREPPAKHDWHTSPGRRRRSGHNWLQVWMCKSCGATTTNEDRVRTS